MKLSIIGPTYPYKGGISHFTTSLVKELRIQHEVDFISWKRQYPGFLYPVEQKDTKSKKITKAKAYFLLDFYNPFSWISAALRIRRLRSDRLIITWTTPIQAPIYFIITLFVKFTSQTRIVYLCHNALPHERHFYDKLLTRMAFLFADEFITHSTEDKDVISQLVENKQIVKAFLPVFEELNNRTKYDVGSLKQHLKLKENVLLFFGYIRPYKGLKYLLKALPEIKVNNPSITVLIVGEFWAKDKGSYLELMQKLKIEEDVVLVEGYVPNEDIGKYFAVSDIVVLPYISATQSGVVQTAYAFDKPVIATNVGGLPDVITQAITGYLVPSKNASKIAEAVRDFYKNPLPKKNLQQIKQQLSWPNYVNLILASSDE